MTGARTAGTPRTADLVTSAVARATRVSDEGISTAAISELIGVSKSRVSDVLRGLERDGVVRREAGNEPRWFLVSPVVPLRQ